MKPWIVYRMTRHDDGSGETEFSVSTFFVGLLLAAVFGFSLIVGGLIRSCMG
jgi:hypothetical protein